MKRKGLKQFAAGFLAGAIIMAAVPALADNERVAALIDRTITLEIAGEVKNLPEGYEILTYDNRTYLPSRYVAEELGATVKWDDTKRWITISSAPVKEVEKIVEVPVEVEKIVYVEDSSYQSLPASVSNSNITMTVEGANRLPSYQYTGATRVSCNIKNNNSSGAINVDYLNAVLTVDGKTYSVSDMPSSVYDSGFSNDIMVGSSYSGWFPFPLIEAGTKNFTLQVPIRRQWDGTMTVLTAKFTCTLSGD